MAPVYGLLLFFLLPVSPLSSPSYTPGQISLRIQGLQLEQFQLCPSFSVVFWSEGQLHVVVIAVVPLPKLPSP